MLTYPSINPIAFNLGPLHVHWYGLMYLFSLLAAYFLGMRRAREPWRGLSAQAVSDILFYAAVGLILGGRLGYMFFYDTVNFIHAPWIVVQVWNGGMSFHGGLVGTLCAAAFAARRLKLSFWTITDFFAPIAPIGLAAGRIGNFINGELWGRVTDSPLGMVFPDAGPFPRYPSQLMECFLEGILLFLVLWMLSRRPWPKSLVSAWFLIGYGVARFTVEFFREPDPQRGFIAFHWMTMGQILSLPMILIGIGLWVRVWIRRHPKE